MTLERYTNNTYKYKDDEGTTKVIEDKGKFVNKDAAIKIITWNLNHQQNQQSLNHITKKKFHQTAMAILSTAATTTFSTNKTL